ncbi:hypothetical protein Patl1_17088 [Pistacia atlantica]|uniref:Uncharacterized protein n=1 Tax=Pistacia atlantica TaxID=434234 RepID=A0ACC1BB25_9ROSI|nr:hypothetical protein Patl1_17088 [Pistacia atlantica]
MDDDEWGPDEEEEGGSVAVVEEGKPKEVTKIDNLKKALLEAENSTPTLTEALTLLNDKWILAAGIHPFPVCSPCCQGVHCNWREWRRFPWYQDLNKKMLLSLLVIALMALYVSLSISILQKYLFMPFFMHLQYRPDNDFISPITAAWTANPCDMGMNFIFVLFYH